MAFLNWYWKNGTTSAGPDTLGFEMELDDDKVLWVYCQPAQAINTRRATDVNISTVVSAKVLYPAECSHEMGKRDIHNEYERRSEAAARVSRRCGLYGYHRCSKTRSRWHGKSSVCIGLGKERSGFTETSSLISPVQCEF